MNINHDWIWFPFYQTNSTNLPTKIHWVWPQKNNGVQTVPCRPDVNLACEVWPVTNTFEIFEKWKYLWTELYISQNNVTLSYIDLYWNHNLILTILELYSVLLICKLINFHYESWSLYIRMDWFLEREGGP